MLQAVQAILYTCTAYMLYWFPRRRQEIVHEIAGILR